MSEPTASTAPLAGDPDGTGMKTASPGAWSWAANTNAVRGWWRYQRSDV